MDCSEVRDNLSAYLDGVIDHESAVLIDDHLKDCEACRAELVSLRELVGELESLRSVRAPDDFLKQLHERIESESPFMRLMRTFFKPIKIKVPLEIATAAAVAVLVISVFSIQQEKEKIISFPDTMEEKDVSKEPAVSPGQIESKKPEKQEGALNEAGEGRHDGIKRGAQESSGEQPAGALEQEAPRSLKEKLHAREMGREEATEKRQKSTISSSPGLIADEEDLKKGIPLEESKSITGSQERHKVPVELRVLVEYESSDQTKKKPQAATKAILDNKKTQGGFGKEAERPAPTTGRTQVESRAPASESVGVVSGSESWKSTDARNIFNEIEKMINKFEGKIIGVQYDDTGFMPQKIDAEIPSGNLKAFCRNLQHAVFMKFPCPDKEDNIDAPHSIPIKIIFEKIE